MSDTPRTDGDHRLYPLPEHAQRIMFDGSPCLAIAPEEYECLFEHARQLERELNEANDRAERMQALWDMAILWGLESVIDEWREVMDQKPCLRCGRPERVNRYHCEQCHEETKE